MANGIAEVKRRTKDGRIAVFNSDSKEFLRFDEPKEQVAEKAFTSDASEKTFEADVPDKKFTPDPVKKFTPDEIPEIKRRTKDGRVAVFNENTKEFIRFSDDLRPGVLAGVRRSEVPVGEAPESFDAFMTGLATEASARQLERAPEFKKALELAETQAPVSSIIGRLTGFSIGPGGKIFKAFSNVLKGTKIMKLLKASKPSGVLVRMAKGSTEAAIAGAEIGVASAGIEALTPGATPKQVLQAGKIGAVAGGGLSSVAKLTVGTLRTVSPRFRLLFDNLDEAAKTSKNPEQVMTESVDDYKKLVEDTRVVLAEEAAVLEGAAKNEIFPILSQLDDRILQVQERVAGAVQSNIAQGRAQLQRSSNELLGTLKESVEVANGVYKTGFDQTIGKFGNRLIKTADIADDYFAWLEKKGFVLKSGKTYVPNQTSPFVRDNVNAVKGMIEDGRQLKSNRLTVSKLNDFKQQVAKRIDFSKNVSKEELGDLNLWSRMSERIETHVDDLLKINPNAKGGVQGVREVNQLYRKHRQVLDRVVKEVGTKPEAVSTRFESLVAESPGLAARTGSVTKGGKRAGKKSFFLEQLDTLGELDKNAQKAISKNIEEAALVTRLTNLEASDVNRVGTLFKKALKTGEVGDAQARKAMDRLQAEIGRIEEIDKVRDFLGARAGAPSLGLTELASAEGAKVARDWVAKNAPRAKKPLNQLIEQSKKMKQLDKLLPEFDSEIQKILLTQMGPVEARAARMLTRINPKFGPLFNRGKVAKALGFKSAAELDNISYSSLIEKIFQSPENASVALNRFKIPGTGEEFHQNWKTLIAIMSANEAQE